MRALVVVLLGLLLLAVPSWAESDREFLVALSAYLDPDEKFLFKHRKGVRALLERRSAQTGVDGLADIASLRESVYKARHFLPRYSDPKWRQDHGVTAFEQDGPIRHLVSERHRLSWSLPDRYRTRNLASVPHKGPLPLLLVVHEEQDTATQEGKVEPHPGGAALARSYPPKTFRTVRDRWLMLAPVAAQAEFLDADGAIRHRFLTGVLADFWRRYHVDFDRIVVDGAAPAAALAATFPQVFAGVVLRPGAEVELDVVRNWADVPVFVRDDDRLVAALSEHGHRSVTTGDDAALGRWLEDRRRETVTGFAWRRKRPDHDYARWIVVTRLVRTSPTAEMTVTTLDTEDDPNTIRIDAAGIEGLRIFLNDEILDLDRPVRLVVNGEVRDLGVIERDFGRLFEKDPEVRRNMNFGWLYTALLDDVRVFPPTSEETDEPAPDEGPPGSDKDEAKAAALWAKAETAYQADEVFRAAVYCRKVVEIGETSYRLRALDRLAELRGPRLTLPDRLAAQQEWLGGRPDRIEEHLGSAAEAVTAEGLLPFAIRDLWWRPVDDPELRRRCEASVADLGGVLANQMRWILAGGGGDPYPRHTSAKSDLWPVLTALVLERQMRETTGARWLPAESPVLRRKVLEAPLEWQDWYARWCAWFYDEEMQTAYHGEDPERAPEAFREADEEQDRIAAGVRTRNAWLAVLVGVLFVGGVFVAGRRASRA